jgi:branched-chain amino acid transport system substrate-binding protein
MHQPQTAALLEPSELAGVCAESGSSPISGGSPQMVDFAKRYRAAFGSEPDAFALGQYDAVQMILAAIGSGARTPDAIRTALANNSHDGLAMAYRSDGKGNMAHDAVIICYDGADRTHAKKSRLQAIMFFIASPYPPSLTLPLAGGREYDCGSRDLPPPPLRGRVGVGGTQRISAFRDIF